MEKIENSNPIYLSRGMDWRQSYWSSKLQSMIDRCISPRLRITNGRRDFYGGTSQITVQQLYVELENNDLFCLIEAEVSDYGGVPFIKPKKIAISDGKKNVIISLERLSEKSPFRHYAIHAEKVEKIVKNAIISTLLQGHFRATLKFQ